MAKSEHVMIARQGTPALIRWREQHPGEVLDFSGAFLTGHNLNRADLAGANLQGADLIGARLNEVKLMKADLKDVAGLMATLNGADLAEANLSGATLRQAEMKGANLAGADLTGVQFRGADLSGARLQGAILAGADITEAKLRGADLTGADLSGATVNYSDLGEVNLRGANLGKLSVYRTALDGAVFHGALMFHTVIGDCDLGGVVGLDEVRHAGPSVVGADSIARSGGRIPDAFLRGTGAPEELVAYQRTLGDAAFYVTCYISYSSKDRSFAEKLQADLRVRGVRCWSSPADVLPGRLVREAEEPALDHLGLWLSEDVDRGIRYYDRLVALCSGDMLATEAARDGMVHGIQRQAEAGRWVFFPVALSDEAYDRRNRYVRGLRLWRHVMYDFRGWEDSQEYAAALDGLIADLVQDQDAATGMVPEEED